MNHLYTGIIANLLFVLAICPHPHPPTHTAIPMPPGQQQQQPPPQELEKVDSGGGDKGLRVERMEAGGGSTGGPDPSPSPTGSSSRPQTPTFRQQGLPRVGSLLRLASSRSVSFRVPRGSPLDPEMEAAEEMADEEIVRELVTPARPPSRTPKEVSALLLPYGADEPMNLQNTLRATAGFNMTYVLPSAQQSVPTVRALVVLVCVWLDAC